MVSWFGVYESIPVPWFMETNRRQGCGFTIEDITNRGGYSAEVNDIITTRSDTRCL